MSTHEDADIKSVAAQGGGKDKLHPRWKSYATRLATAVSSVRKVNCSSKVSKWADAFKKLHSVDDIPILRIDVILKWYCSEIRNGDFIKDNSSFIPIAYSGQVFRRKFLQIEDAQKRVIQKRKKDGPPQPTIKVVYVD